MPKPNLSYEAFVPYTVITVLKFVLPKSLWEGLTMPDEIIEELWQIKDRMAREYGYDIDVFVAHLQSRQQVEGRQVVDLQAMKKATEQAASAKSHS